MLRPKPLTAALLVTLLLVAQNAAAYVLPADFLLRMLADSRRSNGVRDLSMHATTEQVDSGANTDERLYLKRPERLRRVISHTPEELQVQRGDRWARGEEGKLVLQTGTGPTLYALLLMPEGKDLDGMNSRLLQVVKATGIDTAITSLGRDGESIIYIIGAAPWEQDKPQLWLDKDTFLPVRYQFVVEEKGTKVVWQYRLLEFGSAVTGNWFPRVIEAYRNGQLIERTEINDVQLNQDLPETLFDLPRK